MGTGAVDRAPRVRRRLRRGDALEGFPNTLDIAKELPDAI
jgi:hypothetical protein